MRKKKKFNNNWVGGGGELLPIDTRNINDHINHITAELVRLHVHRGAGRRRRRRGINIWRDQNHGDVVTCQWQCRSCSPHQTGKLSQCPSSVWYSTNIMWLCYSSCPEVLTEIRMLSKFSRVGSWGISFCTTLLKACSGGNIRLTHVSLPSSLHTPHTHTPQIWSGHKCWWGRSSGGYLPDLRLPNRLLLAGGCPSVPLQVCVTGRVSNCATT